MERIKVEIVNSPTLKHVIEGARTCWNSQDKSNPQNDAKLLDKLWNLGHGSVFEHCYFTFRITGCSRLCLMEITRHRMASYSVESTRYTLKKALKEIGNIDYSKHTLYDIVTEYIVIPPFKSPLQTHDYMLLMGDHLRTLCTKAGDGLSNDLLKYYLPESWRTNFIWTINLRSLANFIHLRTSSKAHFEVRHIANLILEQSKTCPLIYKFLKEQKQ